MPIVCDISKANPVSGHANQHGEPNSCLKLFYFVGKAGQLLSGVPTHLVKLISWQSSTPAATDV